MKINIESIPQNKQRYPTIGDYWEHADGSQEVRVSQFADHRHEILVVLHELVEYYLCLQRGIKEEDIKAFDEANLDSDDPGHVPSAPYHREHVFAECLERLFAQELGVNWQEYEAACLALFNK
jgi:hypothetical protein